MRRIDRKRLQAPARVLDLELAPVEQVDEDALAVEQYKTIWCLSRLHGVPQEISCWDVAADASVCIRELRDHLQDGKNNCDQTDTVRSAPKTASPDTTVVICTRNRPVGLRAALASLEGQTDRSFRVLVVDNGSSSAATATVLEDVGLSRCEYVVEPQPGLARARNRALSVVRTEVIAWMDDDEVADADWVHRLKEGFGHDARPAAVCGLMLPAELEFEAQVRFEQYGGFNKGRGMEPEVLRMGASSVVSPLYPLPPFGAGGNMAFRTEILHSMGGFDRCLGAGTRTHGGEDTLALSQLLSAGHAVLHWPAAITWHTHRRDMAALRQQLYGYSTGVSAFYASIIRSKPTVAVDVLRLAPYALRDLRQGDRSLRSGQLPDDFPSFLLKAARRGLLEGGFIYAYEAIKDRRQSALAVQQEALSSAQAQ